MASSDPRRVTLRYDVARVRAEWTIREEPVPESHPHDLTSDLLRHLLVAWAARTGRDVMVARNLATRWDEEHPAVGVDPDVCLVEPPPPDRASLTSLRLWEAGHHAPLVAIEVVSPKHPYKDYAVAPEKYAASGTGELWIFDPDLAGPQALGGPHRIQLWVRDEADQFTRVYAGEGPVQSPAVGGWLFAVNEGSRLRLADDPDGRSWWMTGEEAERTAKDAALAAKDAARAEAEAERAAKKAALARVAELEAELGHRKR